MIFLPIYSDRQLPGQPQGSTPHHHATLAPTIHEALRRSVRTTSCFPFENMVLVKTSGTIGILYIPLYLVIMITYFSVSVKCANKEGLHPLGETGTGRPKGPTTLHTTPAP